jgi:hypothetical protein
MKRYPIRRVRLRHNRIADGVIADGVVARGEAARAPHGSEVVPTCSLSAPLKNISVMPGLDPGIQRRARRRLIWIAGSSPAMTISKSRWESF